MLNFYPVAQPNNVKALLSVLELLSPDRRIEDRYSNLEDIPWKGGFPNRA
jgi:hypothetical protein